jgi:hypothetical protein
MENENFDEDLKNRIKQIFDDYNDGATDEGWSRLREKFPEKKRRDFSFCWFAAAVVLLLGILWFWFSSSNIQNTSLEMVKQQPKEANSKLHNVDSVSSNEPVKQDMASRKKLPYSKSIPSANTQNTLVKTSSPVTARRPSIQAQKNKPAESEPQKQAKAETNVQTNTVFMGIKKASVANNAVKKTEAETANPGIASVNKPLEIATKKAVTTKSTGTDSLVKNQQLSIKKMTFNPPVSVDSLEKKQNQLVAKAANPIIKKPVTAKKVEQTKKISEEKSSKFNLGFYAGIHLNYANGSTSQLGLGTGVSTDFRLSKHLKFSTGLGLLQNNLSYGQTIPTSSRVAATSYALASAVTTPILGSQTSSLKSMDASLLALDIPLNLTYTILPGKNSISFSTGLSSNTFIREVYSYQYNTSMAATNPNGVSTSTGTTEKMQSSKRFSNFNLGKTLNLSAGFAYPLGKNKLQIEPFLKYPLGGNGSQQLLFGSAGINLKMNFSTLKK